LKIRIPNIFVVIAAAVILLVLSITFVPSFALRVVVGIPFLLLFPGYVLIAALFPNKDDMDGLERLALSFGMSIPVVALIGLGLNYTPWGIRLQPVLYAISAFILIMAGLAWYRRYRLHKRTDILIDLHLRLPGWEGNPLNKTLSVVLAVSILAAVAVLIYAVAKPKIGERFSEFYILGLQGEAQDYPATFVLRNGQVASVMYGNNTTVDAPVGMVTIGLVNREHEDTTYSIMVTIDSRVIDVNSGGAPDGTIGPISLAHEEKWEKQIGFAPDYLSNDQKVEFFLYKNGATVPYLTLHLWINVVDGSAQGN
jgi:uncharacterized membrane protein